MQKEKGIRNHRVGSMTKSQWMSIRRKHPEQGLRTVWVMNRHNSDKARCSGRIQPPHRQRRKRENEEMREIWQEYGEG